MTQDTMIPLVRFTPCGEFHPDDDSELCVGCGWSAEEHDALDVAA